VAVSGAVPASKLCTRLPALGVPRDLAPPALRIARVQACRTVRAGPVHGQAGGRLGARQGDLQRVRTGRACGHGDGITALP